MLVYKQYTQEQLDLQYNNRHHVPDFERYLNRWEVLSRAVEHKLDRRRKWYGEMEREYIDIFPAAHPNAKSLVFIHGGYWRTFDTSIFYFVADAFAAYGITTALINYPLAPLATIDQIVASCRAAMEWLHDNLRGVNGDPAETCLLGHSAGAHLAAMMNAKSSTEGQGNFAKSMCLVSGLFNLIPIQASVLNESLKMDRTTASRNSPAFLPPSDNKLTTVAFGTDETDEFRAQSQELVSCWSKASRGIELLQIPGLNHFSIMDSIMDATTPLHRAICQMMQLGVEK
jgi:arylformamidase